MSNIKHTFQNGKAFIAFITCGNPDLETTAAAVLAAQENGADLIELGIPFSDPTSKERIAMIAKEAQGFLYIVSSLGVTGTRKEIKTDLTPILKEVRKNTKIPCAVGFGISTPEQARQMSAFSDGVIVGSAIIKLLAQYGKKAPSYIGAYVKSMKDAINCN